MPSTEFNELTIQFSKNGPHWGELEKVLAQVYPTVDELEVAIKRKFSETLGHIAGNDPRFVYFKLIQWADSKGKALPLMSMVLEAGEGNPHVTQFFANHPDYLQVAIALLPSSPGTAPVSTHPAGAGNPSHSSAPVGVPTSNVPPTNSAGNMRRVWRVVLASPGDVQPERNLVGAVVEELNKGVAAAKGIVIELIRWETDAVPGFSNRGPQGVIDPILRIEEAEFLIGIFWKKFGTPVHDADSGTEHEIRLASAAWQSNDKPQILLYFKQKPFLPSSTELEQYGKVLKFQQEMGTNGLYATFEDEPEFERLVRNHLTDYILKS